MTADADLACFAVQSILAHGALLKIDGRCLDCTIEIGDVFDFVCRIRCKRNKDGPVYTEPVERFDMRPVRLRVQGIRCYGQDVSSLSQCVTGELELSGTGGDPIEEQMVLGVRGPATQP